MNLVLEFESSTISALMANAFVKEHLFKAASVINFVLSCALYVATAFLYGFIIFFHVPKNLHISGDKKLKDYMNLFKNKRILETVFFWIVFMFCIGVTSPLEVSMIEEKLKMPSHWYGVGNAVEGVGMLVASAFVLGKIRKLKPSSVISLGACLVGMTDICCIKILYPDVQNEWFFDSRTDAEDMEYTGSVLWGCWNSVCGSCEI